MRHEGMVDQISHQVEIGQRIVALRTAMGFANAAAFAKAVKISPQSLNNYERGFRRPELEQATKIVKLTGATLDWIYYGERAGLPLQLAERLGISAQPPFAEGKRA